MLERGKICLRKDRIESKMNQRFLVEEIEGLGCVEGRESDGLMVLEVCCVSPKRRNSVLDGLRGGS